MGAGDLRPGQVVVSLAGRDKGRAYVVMRVLSERAVLVADGERRKVVKPKMKNTRHLRPGGLPNEELARRLADGMAVSDQDLRRVLQEFASGGTNGG